MKNNQETKEYALLRVGMANKEDYCIIFDFAADWVKKQFRVFNANDFKKAYLEKHKMPQQVNVFGAVFANMAREKMIYMQGAVVSKTPESKGCLIRTWISLEYKQKQQNNAAYKYNLKLEL